MKYVKILLCCGLCCAMMLLTACKLPIQHYKDGLENLEIKNYTAAEASFKSAIEGGYKKDNIKVIYAIVSEYNKAKKCFDNGEYEQAQKHVDNIPHTYSNYLIGIDINDLKDKLEEVQKIADSISKVKKYLESGDYEDANAIVLNIDTEHASEEQIKEIDELKLQVKLERKNHDYEVTQKINSLVTNYVYGLCEAVNMGDFRPLKGCLYENSSIYKEQKSYISKMAKKDITEYVIDYEVTNIEWKTETTCIISTIETYGIYQNFEYTTQTFRYKYNVIETEDKQLFLTTIEKSS